MDPPNDISDAGNELMDPEIIVADGKQFLELPDDCLIDISRYLPLEDLISVALTCSRLRDIVRQTFSLQPMNKHVDLPVDVLQMPRSFEPNAMEKTERYLQIFGDLLVDVSIRKLMRESRGEQEIFHLITKYCSDGALEEFSGYELALDTPNSSEKLRLFSRLKVIHLTGCTMVEDALAASIQCQSLSLSNQYFNGVISNLHFPKLETFHIYGSRSEFQEDDDANYAKFLRRHIHLRTLELTIRGEADAIRDAIGDLKDLEILELYGCNASLTLNPWCKLKKLKTLDVGSDASDATKFLMESPAAESMEYLSLDQPILNHEFFIGLSRFKKLRELILTLDDSDSTQPANEEWPKLYLDELNRFCLSGPGSSNLTVDGLVGMVENAQKLISITLLDTDHEIDSRIYDRLVKICQKENKKLKISLMQTMGWRKPARGINYNQNFVQVTLINATDL